MIGETGVGVKVAVGAGVTGGLALAVAEGVVPDSTAMMYSLALAVIALATLIIKGRSGSDGAKPVSNSDLMSKLEEFAYGPMGINGRVDQLSKKIDFIASSIGTFRENTGRELSEYRARIEGLEAKK